MTQLEIVLLSLLCEKNYYGYEIESIIEKRHIREWTKIGFSSIYHSLNKLEKKELVSSYVEKEYGSPKRKVYSINKDAENIVRKEINQLLCSPEKIDSDFSIGLAFSHLLSKEEVVAALNEYRESLEKRRQRILKRYSEQPMVKDTPQLRALFTRPLKLIEAEIEWINEFVKGSTDHFAKEKDDDN